MCGIIGYIGKRNCLPILIKGLKKLEYRGYDSAGIAYISNKTKTIKTKGRITDLEKIMPKNDKAFIGIGHTRWATHGQVNKTNSHPHTQGNITIVHNGILENYQEIKKELNNNYKFITTTDTEIAAAYIDYIYNQTKDMIKTLNICLNKFIGSYAIAIIINNNKDELYFLKKDSPLVIGLGKDENFIASDINAFANTVKNYLIIDDLELGKITKNNITVYKNNTIIQKEIKHLDNNEIIDNLNNYEHYMLKEIHEQSDIINKLNQTYLENLDKIPNITKYKNIHIIGCGTAYHAGLIGKYLLENFTDFEINTYIASEYRYQKIFANKNTLVIVTSQSGETADTIACLKKAKKHNCHTIGIVNVKDSTIARMTDEVIYTEAGPEIAVASTKAYTSQIYIYSLIALKLAINKKKLTKKEVLPYYQNLPHLIKKITDINYNDIIKTFYNDHDLFYLGRNIDYATVLEGSLKLKEISYIHSEAYQAGELKHGTISLIEKNTCIISLITNDETSSKTISNIKETKARSSYVILLIKKSLNKNISKDTYDKIIEIPDTNYLIQPILNVIPLQLIAYYVAKKRGCDIDKPRNLAKSVTVE